VVGGGRSPHLLFGALILGKADPDGLPQSEVRAVGRVQSVPYLLDGGAGRGEKKVLTRAKGSDQKKGPKPDKRVLTRQKALTG
jgi:hypothetical protein